MAKISLANILSGFSLNRINDNFQRIQDALNNNVLYRDNPQGEDNTIKQDIDMNGHKLYNLAAPGSDNEAARLKDVKNAIAGLGGYTANLIAFEPTPTVTANTVQGAIESVDQNIGSNIQKVVVTLDRFLTSPGVITQAEYDNAKAYAKSVNGVLRLLGSYSFSSLNIADDNLVVECGPQTVLTHTGSGPALQIDAGTSGSGMFNFELRGEPLIVGNASTTDGVYIRAIHHGFIKARVKNVATAYRVLFSVCTKYEITCSVNENAFGITPTAGLVTGERLAGESVQDCEFYVTMEGISGWGVELNNTYGCEFRGTSEGNTGGVVQVSTCGRNEFIAFDLESNTSYDLMDYSENSTYTDCYAISLCSNNNAEMVLSRGAKFIGGFWRTVNCQSTSADTLFIGVSTSDNASLGFKGAGAFKTINCVKQNTSGVTTVRIIDQLGESGTWTPAFASAAGGVQGSGTAVGTYFRIGKLCYVQGFMSIPKGTLGEGAVSIIGFPFASRTTTNDYQYIQMAEWDNIALGTGFNTLVARIAPGESSGTLLQSGTSVPSATVNVSAFPTSMGIRFSGVYEVA